MITSKLKDILGADLVSQIDEKIKGKGKDGADIDIVIGNDGSFVAKETHDMAVGKNTQAETLLATIAGTLKDLGASGNAETLAADVLKVKGDFADLQAGHTKAMTKLQKETALKLGLGASVYDPGDVIARLDLEKIELDDSGKLKGDLKELLKPIREAAPHYFKPEEKGGTQLRGASPGQVGGGNAGDDIDGQMLDSAFGLAKGDK